jgi:6-phosphogluconolactonase (cycloisomerase 2 family)
VTIYQVDRIKGISLIQELHREGYPQHAIYSRDGKSLVVANWGDETLAVYQEGTDGFFEEVPSMVTPFPEKFHKLKPHGITFSPQGDILAVALGASKLLNKGIALFKKNPDFSFTLLDLYQDDRIESGIPKGIAFTPDGGSLMVTLAQSDSAAIYEVNLDEGKVLPKVKQVLTGLSRPEDVKFSPDGSLCAISNSSANSIAFFKFERETCSIGSHPQFTLENPAADLNFPHGLAFSSDGGYLAVTQFGPVILDKYGDLYKWAKKRRDCVALYLLGDKVCTAASFPLYESSPK